MIRKLSEKDREELLAFLRKNAEISLFIIGDLESFGFNDEIQELWGEFNEDGSYQAVLIRYRIHFNLYAPYGSCDFDSFVAIMNTFPQVTDMSGELSVIENIARRVPYKKIKRQHFAKLTSDQRLELPSESVKVKKAVPEDAEALFAMRERIVEFTDFKPTLEGIRAMIAGGFGRTYVVKDEGRIAAAASTTAENSSSAMVVAVMTDPDYRNRGYASAVVSTLCRVLLEEDRTLCLFYDNPKAGRIYKRLGFEDIADWGILIFSKPGL